MFVYKGITGHMVGEWFWSFELNGRQQSAVTLKFAMFMIDNKELYK